MSRIFVGRKKLTTEKNHICRTFRIDAAVPENLIPFFFFWPNVVPEWSPIMTKRSLNNPKQFPDLYVSLHNSVSNRIPLPFVCTFQRIMDTYVAKYPKLFIICVPMDLNFRHINCLFVFFLALCRFQQSVSHVATVSGCGRKLNTCAHF